MKINFKSNLKSKIIKKLERSLFLSKKAFQIFKYHLSFSTQWEEYTVFKQLHQLPSVQVNLSAKMQDSNFKYLASTTGSTLASKIIT